MMLLLSPVILLLWLSPFIDCQLNEIEKKTAESIADGFFKAMQSHDIKKDAFKELNQCLNRLSEGLKQREDLIKKLKVNIDKIWVTDQPQTLTAKVFVDGTVRVKNLMAPKRLIITRPEIKSVSDPVNLEKRFDRASKKVNKLVDLVENQVVRKDKANQSINGTIHFLNPIKADNIRIASIKSTTEINKISLKELRTNVLRKSGNQVITGNWKFSTTTINVDNLTVNGLLSGVNMSNILLTNSPEEQLFTGHLKIRQGNFRSLQFESINGIRKDELVYKSHGMKKIKATKTFKRVISAAGIKLVGRLNGQNWTHLVRNSININSPNPIKTTLRFVTVPEINNLTVRSINNMTIDNLKAGLTPEELVQLSGNKTFRSLSANKVTLNGKLNGLSIPNDLINLRSLQDLQEPITFDGHVTFKSNLTIGKINDVDIVRDTVRRWSTEPQVIHGTKIFDRPVHVRNLQAKETRLRHINLDDLDPLAEDGSQFARRSNVIYKEKLTINGDLRVNTINGIPIDQLIGSLFSRSRDQVISWPTQFNGRLSIDSVSTNKVNGLTIPNDLVLINTKGAEQVITGRKVFETLTLEPERELIMKGHTLNGKDLNLLEQAIIKNDPSMRKDCYGRKSFSKVKVLGNIIAEKVNGLDLARDVMLADRPQNITGKLVFTSDVQAYQVSFPAGLQVRTINGNPVDKALDELVLHDSQSVTLENKDFRGGLVADEIDLLGTINGVNLTNLMSSVIRLDTPQAVHSPLKFEDEVTFDNPIDTRSVNGRDLQRIFDLAKASSASPGGIKIIGNVKINGDVITGRLNGQTPEKLREFIFPPKIDNHFDRPVIFNSPITIDHLTVSKTATLDGLAPRDLLQLDKPIHLDQPLRIRGNAYIDHQLIVRSGVINNCALSDIALLSDYRNTSNAVHFQQPINFNQVNILGNLQLIQSTINDVNIDKLAHQVELIVPKDQRFNSSFIFTDDVYVDELFIEGPINGVNLREIYADSVRQSAGYQRITGHKIFKSLKINDGDVTFNGNVNLRGTINGINLTKLYDNLIKPGEYNVVRGIKIFTSNQPIVLHNIESPLLGGVNLSDLALAASPETINTETTFIKPVEVNNLVTRSHYGRNLVNRQSSAQFMDPVSVKQLKVKRINGVPIENFVSTLKDTQLNGSYTIDKLYIHGDLITDPRSTINGIDLSEINNRSVDIRSTRYIPGVIILNGGANFEQGIDLINYSGNRPGGSTRLDRSVEMELRQLEDALKDETLQLGRLTATVDKKKRSTDGFNKIDDHKLLVINATTDNHRSIIYKGGYV